MALATVAALSPCMPAFAASNPEDPMRAKIMAPSPYEDDTVLLRRVEPRAISTGLCTYNATKDKFETSPSLYLLFENGAHNSHVINRTAMKVSQKYYGFVRNLIEDNVHKVNGTVYYYDDYD